MLFGRSRCDNLGVWRALTVFSAADFAAGFGFGLQQKLASSLLENGEARISGVYSFLPPWKQPLNLGRLHYRHLRRIPGVPFYQFIALLLRRTISQNQLVFASNIAVEPPLALVGRCLLYSRRQRSVPTKRSTEHHQDSVFIWQRLQYPLNPTPKRSHPQRVLTTFYLQLGETNSIRSSDFAQG